MRLDPAAGTGAPAPGPGPAEEAPGDEAASTGSAEESPTAWRRHRADIVLGLLVPAVFLANLSISIGVEGEGIWRSDPWEGYWLNLGVTALGVFLLYVPINLYEAARSPRYEFEYDPGVGWWTLGVTVVAFIMVWARSLPVWRRAVYAYLIGAQVAGFAAVHWSTLGN